MTCEVGPAAERGSRDEPRESGAERFGHAGEGTDDCEERDANRQNAYENPECSRDHNSLILARTL